MTSEEVALHLIHATAGDTKRLNEATALIERHVTEILSQHGIKKFLPETTKKLSLALSSPVLDLNTNERKEPGFGPVKATLSDKTEYRNAYYAKQLRVSEAFFDTIPEAIRNADPIDEERYVGVLRMNYHKGYLVDIKLVS